MVLLNDAKTQVRNFLATGNADYPKYMLFGSDTTSANVTDSTMTSLIATASFENVNVGVTRQVKYEAILLTTQATGSDISQIGLSSDTTGTSGTLFTKENINTITKTKNFDIQVIEILEIT